MKICADFYAFIDLYVRNKFACQIQHENIVRTQYSHVWYASNPTNKELQKGATKIPHYPPGLYPTGTEIIKQKGSVNYGAALLKAIHLL